MVAKVLLAQFGVTLVLAMLFWGTDGRVSGYSALLGGLTCVIPNAFLALRLALPRRTPPETAPPQALSSISTSSLTSTVVILQSC